MTNGIKQWTVRWIDGEGLHTAEHPTRELAEQKYRMVRALPTCSHASVWESIRIR